MARSFRLSSEGQPSIAQVVCYLKNKHEPQARASRGEIKIEDKTVNEKVQIIAQLEEDDKQAVYRITDSMLTSTKFQDFFQKNLPAAQ